MAFGFFLYLMFHFCLFFCVEEEFSFLLTCMLCIMHIYRLFSLLFENRNDIWPARVWFSVPLKCWADQKPVLHSRWKLLLHFTKNLGFFWKAEGFYILQFWKGLTASCITCVDQKLQQGFTILMGDKDPNHRDAIFNTTELCCLLRKYWHNLCILT